MKHLHEIRQECHKRVFQAVKSCPHGDIHIIREPYQTLQPSCKAIVVVSDVERAKALENAIKGIVDTSNDNIEAELKGSLEPQYEIKYKVKTLLADGDIILTERTAEKRIKTTGKSLYSRLENIISRLDRTTEQHTIKQIQAFIETLNKDGNYVFSVQTGNSYRVTYFDSTSASRKQCNVGNVLIVVGSGKVKTPEQRKQRSDKKFPIFTASCSTGQIAVYNNN
jgi:hypothetical protein